MEDATGRNIATAAAAAVNTTRRFQMFTGGQWAREGGAVLGGQQDSHQDLYSYKSKQLEHHAFSTSVA